jgi:hypothetical protein
MKMIDLNANALVGRCAGSREKAQTIVSGLVKNHERELAGWNYLQLVMAKTPPDTLEEIALYEILTRARRDRY